jgi:hypothetical protein
MAKKTKNKFSDECEEFDEKGNPLADGCKPIQLSSLITKLQAIMSKHGDLPVYVCTSSGFSTMDIRVELKEENEDPFTRLDRTDKVMIYTGM